MCDKVKEIHTTTNRISLYNTKCLYMLEWDSASSTLIMVDVCMCE